MEKGVFFHGNTNYDSDFLHMMFFLWILWNRGYFSMKKRQSKKRRSTINAKKIRSGKSNIHVFVITVYTPVSDQEIRDFEELSLYIFLRYFCHINERLKKVNDFAAVKKTAQRLFLRLMPCSYSSTVQQNGTMATYHQCLASVLKP